MKIEPRGKFGGVKIHLDASECQELMGATPAGQTLLVNTSVALKFTASLSQKLKKLIKEVPDLLADKSPDQIKKELELEAKKSIAKLQALAGGKPWDPSRGIKVLVQE